jgi:hypothetical protein
MPFLTVEGGYSAEFGKPFSGILCDDGHERRPVTATRTGEHWLRIGENDFRQITSVWSCNGQLTICVLPSRLGRAEQARQKRIQEARAAALGLQAALGKLDVADRGRARMLDYQLGRWLEMPQSTPVEPPARQGEADRRAAASMPSAPGGVEGLANAARCFFCFAPPWRDGSPMGDGDMNR